MARLSNMVGDYSQSGTIIDRQQVIADGVQTVFSLTFIDGSEEIYKNGLRMLKGAGQDYVTDATNSEITFNTVPALNDELLLIGRAASSEIPFQKGSSETAILTDGQQDVTFTSIQTEGIAIYVNGPLVDKGRLVSPTDYILKAGSTDTITLQHTYPAGSVIEGIQGGRQAWVDPDNMVVNDGTTVKSLSERFRDTQESLVYWQESTGRQRQTLVAGLNLVKWQLDASGNMVQNVNGTHAVLNILGSLWDQLFDYPNEYQVISWALVDQVLEVRASEVGSGAVVILRYGRRVDVDNLRSIRMGRLDNPSVHVFKKNELVDALEGPLTFERTTTATYVDIYGILRTADIDTPRQEAAGWLLEGASTNLIINSSGFSNASDWNTYSGAYSGTSYSAPDGTDTASELVDSSTTARASVAQGVPVAGMANGDIHSFSCHIKQGTAAQCRIQIQHNQTTSVYSYVDFDFASETLTPQRANNVGSGFEKLANGWYKIWTTILQADPAGYSNTGLYIYPASDGGVAGTGGTLLWGAQFEELPWASSYIPTSTAAVSRAADIVTLPTYMNMPNGARTISFNSKLIGVSNTNTAQSIVCWKTAGSDSLSQTMYQRNGIYGAYDGTNLIEPITTADTEAHQFAIVLDNESGVIFQDGIDIYSMPTFLMGDIDTAGSISVGSHYLGAINNHMYGHISDLRIYDFALSSSEMTFLAGN